MTVDQVEVVSVRPVWRDLGRALGFVYLPQLAPLFVGPLTECSHCVATYWKLFAILPGMFVPIVLRSQGGAGIAWAAIPTLAIVAGLTVVLRRRPPWARAAAWSAAVVLGVQALAFAGLLRM